MIGWLIATVAEALKSALLDVGIVFGALGTIYQWGYKPTRHLARRVKEVHGVLLGEDDNPSLTKRLVEGDARMARIEGDVKDVKGELQDVNQRVGNMEGTLDVLGAQERQEIRAIITVARDREAQRPKDQPERRKHGGL